MPRVLVIGITGGFRTGKHKVAKRTRAIAQNSGFRVLDVDLPDILRQSLQIFQRPVTRDAMNEYSDDLNKLWGPNFLLETAANQFANTNFNFIIVEGISRQEEIDWIRSHENSCLVYVRAPDDLCFERTRRVTEFYHRENQMTRSEFNELRASPPESIIPTFEEQADFIYDNSIDEERNYHFLREMDRFWEFLEPKLP